MSEEDEDVSVTELLKRQGVGVDDFRVVIGTTRVVYDDDKENRNRLSHHYSLASATVFIESCAFPFGSRYPILTLWQKRDGEEVRHVHFGLDEQREVVRFVTTMRSPETVRVISFRKAQPKGVRELIAHYGADVLRQD